MIARRTDRPAFTFPILGITLKRARSLRVGLFEFFPEPGAGRFDCDSCAEYCPKHNDLPQRERRTISDSTTDRRLVLRASLLSLSHGIGCPSTCLPRPSSL